LISKESELTTIPYYSEKLMAHVRRNIPGFAGFKADFYTYFVPAWNPIYGDVDWSGDKMVGAIVKVEQVLYQRDRLLQIFHACPQDSYGYYAAQGLGPVKFVVQSFASAEIDKFFASCAQYLSQPFSERINFIMSTLETLYWNSRPAFIDWAAGQLLGQYERAAAVRNAALVGLVSLFLDEWQGSYTQLAESRELTHEQIDEVVRVLTELAPQIDSGALEVLTTRLGKMYDEAVKKNETRDEAEKKKMIEAKKKWDEAEKKKRDDRERYEAEKKKFREDYQL
jgi:hypothetical protein